MSKRIEYKNEGKNNKCVKGDDGYLPLALALIILSWPCQFVANILCKFINLGSMSYIKQCEVSNNLTLNSTHTQDFEMDGSKSYLE